MVVPRKVSWTLGEGAVIAQNGSDEGMRNAIIIINGFYLYHRICSRVVIK